MGHRKFKNVSKRNREAEKKKRTQMIISFFFIGLMVFSVLGIYASQRQNSSLNSFKYGKYTFDVVTDSSGQTSFVSIVEGSEKVFYSLPQDTLQIPLEGNITSIISSSQYIALATNVSLQAAPLIDLMRFDFDRYAQVIVANIPLSNGDNSGINCLNATAEIPVITLVESNETSIVVDKFCIQINSLPDDLYLVRDRLLYSLLGIIND